MADILATINPTTGMYATLALCEAAENRNWVAAGDTGTWMYVGDWSAGPDASTAVVDGGNADATFHVLITTDSANRVGATWDTTKAIAFQLICRDPYLRVTGVQFGTVNAQVRCQDVGSFIWMDSLYMRRDDTANGFNLASSGSGLAVNCISDHYTGGTVNEGFNTGGTAFSTLNCTSISTVAASQSRGFIRTAGTMTCVNCLAYTVPGNTGLDFSGTIGGSNNASSDATAPGSGSLINIADPFTNLAGGDLSILDSASIAAAGIDLRGNVPPVAVDIIGVARNTATPTIGAFQVPIEDDGGIGIGLGASF